MIPGILLSWGYCALWELWQAHDSSLLSVIVTLLLTYRTAPGLFRQELLTDDVAWLESGFWERV